MDKSAHRNQGKSRASVQQGGLSTPLTGLISDPEKAQELIGEAEQYITRFSRRALPAIKKFSRENWKTIALVGAGVSIVTVGAFMYFGQAAAKKGSSELHH